MPSFIGAGLSPNLPGGEGTDTEFAVRQARMTQLKDKLEQGKASKAELQEACKDFEAIFINKLWNQMRSTIPKEGYLHSKYEDKYLSMFDNELSKKFANSGGIGLADMLYEQLATRLKQEASPQEADVRSLGGPDRLGGLPSLDDVPGVPGGGGESHVNPADLSREEVRRRVDELAGRIAAEAGSADGSGKSLADSPENTPPGGRNDRPGARPENWASDGLARASQATDGAGTADEEKTT
jgi:hypothetical protein